MNSSIINGEVLDWKTVKSDFQYSFYIGNVLVGQLFNLGKLGWTAVPLHRNIQKVDGFKTKYKAQAYIAEKYQINLRNHMKLTPTQVYNKLVHLQILAGSTMRQSNIFAVKHTWFYYNNQSKFLV